jgi:glycosylphosphatidylinositol phospholipase D
MALAGLTLAATAAWGQSDPFSEPFPAVLELADLDGEIGFAAPGLSENDRAGFSVATAGDVNGDGIQDFVIGAYRAGPGGVAYVVFGRNQGSGSAFPQRLDLSDLDGQRGFRMITSSAFDQVGYSVASAGDVNHDGLDDLILGDPAGLSISAAYVVFGRDGAAGGFPAEIQLDDLDGSDGFRLRERDGQGQVGISVASAGDVNHDGVTDIIVGANTLDDPDLGPRTGASYVVFGRDTSIMGLFEPEVELDVLSVTDGFKIVGASAGDLSGSKVAGAGDINGDGVGDVIIGAASADPEGLRFAGAAYVVFGRDVAAVGPFPAAIPLAGLDGINGFRVRGLDASGACGASVASLGDVNGDGLDDAIIGAPRSGTGWRGESYVIFGKNVSIAGPFPASLDRSGLDGVVGFRIDGAAGGDEAGWSVTGADDINADGFDDVVVGAYSASPAGRTFAGSSSVVYGRDTTTGSGFPAVLDLADLDGIDGFSIHGIAEFDRTGERVAPAGDVNGDGVGDIIIGASRVDPEGRSDAGEVYIVYGRRPCRPDLDADGALTIFDFLAFQNFFDAMDPAADFDGDGDFTIFDFLAFQNAFDAGCP